MATSPLRSRYPSVSMSQCMKELEDEQALQDLFV